MQFYNNILLYAILLSMQSSDNLLISSFISTLTWDWFPIIAPGWIHESSFSRTKSQEEGCKSKGWGKDFKIRDGSVVVHVSLITVTWVRFSLRAVIWLQLPWSHVKRVLFSLNLYQISQVFFGYSGFLL